MLRVLHKNATFRDCPYFTKLFDLLLPFIDHISHCMRVTCKVYGFTLLLQVGTLWRYGDGLFFEVPPL